jgi:hypothetical protein
MATTSNTYTGNGSNKLFSITFPYLDTADIDVYLNGTLQTVTTQYFFANATTVEFVTAPGNGATVLLDRSTNDAAPNATFFPGSSIKAADLNTNFDQALFIAQETVNSAASQSTAGLQTQITAATNTANSANTTANNASATANGIAGTANTALANANTAISTANAASVTATNAETTANAISATASSAVSTANAAQSTANTANTTANAALPKAGGTMTGVITYAAAQPRMVLSTSVASTSGTSIDFTSIPSWAKQVTVMLYNVSTNGAVNPIIQLGSGSFTTSGYSSGCGSSGGNTSETSGFIVSTGTASSDSLSGSILFSSIGISNRWVCSGTTYNGSNSRFISGNVSLSGDLDRVRITTIASASTFDGGTINIIYEG